MSNELPYIIRTIELKSYNPNYGDNRICECGHAYYRHFDSYEDMEPCGCKYCCCYEFVEIQEGKDTIEDARNKGYEDGERGLSYLNPYSENDFKWHDAYKNSYDNAKLNRTL